ncbi:MAG TPA: class A beta-lactamase [Chryseolinea sp.]|nr:class A beta-lactamase [Chryseolinea sp.]
MRFRIFFLFALSCISVDIVAQNSLRAQVAALAESISGDVGIAIRLIERGDTLSYHGTHPFPMQSVYKFPLALQLMNDMDNGKLTLEQKVNISKDEYYQTHSPLMKEYPEGDVSLTVTDLLKFMIEWSDNIACDILFRQAGGPKRVDLFLHGQGIRDMAMRNTEREMHANDQLQYQNWSTPLAMLQLLTRFYHSDMLSEKSRAILWNMMVNTKTGPKRIRGLLPTGTVVANRTGTGNITKERRVSAVNDIGIMELPNGEHLAMVVYVTNSREEIPAVEEVIAKIAKAAFDQYGTRK